MSVQESFHLLKSKEAKIPLKSTQIKSQMFTRKSSLPATDASLYAVAYKLCGSIHSPSAALTKRPDRASNSQP